MAKDKKYSYFIGYLGFAKAGDNIIVSGQPAFTASNVQIQIPYELTDLHLIKRLQGELAIQLDFGAITILGYMLLNAS